MALASLLGLRPGQAAREEAQEDGRGQVVQAPVGGVLLFVGLRCNAVLIGDLMHIYVRRQSGRLDFPNA